MREQLELLWEIQKIDLELRHINDDRDRWPKEVKRLSEKQTIEQERVQKEKEKIELLEKERRRREGNLSLEQEKIKRAQARMFEVKTNKEYQALLHEIDTLKEIHSREEEEILQVMEEIDELKKSIAKREKEVEVTLGNIAEEIRVIEAKMVEGETVWNRQVERREVLSKQLETSLMKLYSTLKEKRQGVGMVSVRHETCQGCYVHIPPQMYIEVQRNTALIRCPNCNRILYWEGDRKAG